MNSYILIMTIVFSSYGKGGAGVTTIEVQGESNCYRIGRQWVSSVEHHYTARPTFLCIKKEKTQ